MFRYYRRKIWFLLLIRACCFINVISVCMNTPQTFEKYPMLRYATLIIDIVTGVILACEALIKILHKGFVESKKAYLKSAGRVFEFVMVICIFASICLQIYELKTPFNYSNGDYLMISFVRVPRPLLLLRVMKSVLNLSLPKTVSYRSMKQIWGVLLFTLYFLILAALMGVQMFGLMNSYCIKIRANASNIQSTDLLIPSTRCPDKGNTEQAYKCPPGFKCAYLNFSGYHTDRRPFDQILIGLLTVYEASSMEGWSTVMFAALDIRYFLFAVFYMIVLILFISLLVKNVFIAIITEAFADLRLQVTKSKSPQQTQQKNDNNVKVLRKTEDNSLRLEHHNAVSRRTWVKQLFFRIMYSMVFQIIILLVVLADAVLQCSYSKEEPSKYLQIMFTLIFDIEAALKIIAIGRKQYFQSTQFCFEFFLCVGSSICLPLVFLERNGFAIFQVLRPFRIVLIFSSLRSFLKRILGSGKKIGSLVVFTIAALIISAGIILQLFCGTGLKKVVGVDDYAFDNFPSAVKALFQIFMTEAWVEIMDDVLYRGGLGLSFLVFAVFILFHLLAATILISVFVALILDNLELNEEVKIAKQRRLGEEVADTQEKLPRRMRLYQKLKPQPKLTKIDYVETSLPKIRQSFVTNYVTKGDEIDEQLPLIAQLSSSRYKREADDVDKINLDFVENKPDPLSFSKFRKQSSVSALMQDSQNKRMSLHSGSNNSTMRRQKTMSKSIQRGVTHTISKVSTDDRRMREHPVPHSLHRLSSNQSTTSSSSNRSNERHRVVNATGNVDRMKDIDVGAVRQKLEEAQRKKEAQIEFLRENHPLFDKSLFIFPVNNTIRKIVQKIVHTRYYSFSKDDKGGHIGGFSPERIKRYLGSQTVLEWAMLLCTQVSIVAMFVETPNFRTFDNTTLTVIEYIFVVSSTFELVLKIIADGLIFAPNAFIRDAGSLLHVLIYIVSLIYVCWRPEVIAVGSFAQVILVLRGLRPLRLITLAPPLRKVVAVLLNGYKDIIKVAILQVALMFVFASYGVQYLGGQLQRCNDPDILTKPACKGTYSAKIAGPNDFTYINGTELKVIVPRVWHNPQSFNFDNMQSAFLALLEVLSLEGWTEVRDIIEDKVGFWGSIFPHVYVFCAGLIGLTLFIGVIVSNFNENKGTALLTVEQKRWKDLKKKISLAQPLHLPSRPSEGTFRLRLFEIFVGKMYNRFYAIVIFINSATLCAGQWVPTSPTIIEYFDYITSVSIACCMIFAVDTLLKIYTFRWSGYWLSWRNRFDFLLMVCGVIFSLWNISSCYGMISHDNACRLSKQFGVAVFILRFLSLSGKHNGLRMLMLTVIMSLLKSFYTISVLVCLIMCYAFIGVILFGSLKPGLAINRTVNFRRSYNAFLLLFRVTTGEDWNKLMRDAMIQRPYCVYKPNTNYWESNCGNPTAALFYFHSYYLIISYIFLNLFIAVVIENFSIFYSTDDDPIMSQQDIQWFQETWNRCDEEKSGSMSLDSAKEVLRQLKGGLSIQNLKKDKPLIYKSMCAELEKVKTGKNVTFHNLLFVLAYNKIDVAKSLQLDERLQREELEMVILEEVATETIRNWVMRMAQKRRQSKKPRNKLERRLSGIFIFV